ncbi:MAG: S8 family serine peptidase [Nitrososphaerota archaeon]|jgi:subtilisin family serine protease|nr:S8 family serine peptidase [Nitrososphaerota archaeon]
MRLSARSRKRYSFLLAVIIIVVLVISALYPLLNSLVSAKVEVVRDVIIGFTGSINFELLSGYNISILEVYNIISAVHALVPQSVIGLLERSRGIAYVADNAVLKVEGSINWGVDGVGASNIGDYGITGAGVKVAVLDSGVAELGDYLKVSGGYNFVDNNNDTSDVFGHGTWVASIIGTKKGAPLGFVGVSPDVEIYAVKVIDNRGVGRLSRAISGVEWAVDNGMDIISMSWCISDNRDFVLKQALDRAYYEHDILAVAAVGKNEDVASGVGCPAEYESTIAVTATKEDPYRRCDWVRTGPEVELAAPGENVYCLGTDSQVQSVTGTSFAVAYVVGTAALVKEANSTLTNAEIRDILCQTANDLQLYDNKNRDIYFGYGLINAAAAIQMATGKQIQADTNNQGSSSHSSASLGGSTNTPPPTNTPTNTPPPTNTPTNTPPPTNTVINGNSIVVVVGIIVIAVSVTSIVFSTIKYSKNKKRHI